MKLISAISLVFLGSTSLFADASRFANFTARLGTYTNADAATTWNWSPANRADAQDAYFNIYVPNDATPFSSTANLATMTPGLTSQAWRNAQILTINYHRYYTYGTTAYLATEGNVLAQNFFEGIDTPAYINTTVQDALEANALMNALNTRISHTPDASWMGYTPLAAAGAASDQAYLQLDRTTHTIRPSANLEVFIADVGPSNFERVGHRTMVLGTAPFMNVATVASSQYSFTDMYDDTLYNTFPAPTPVGTEAIVAAWPAKDAFVPYQWFWMISGSEGVRMSAALAGNPSLSGVVVTVKRNGVDQPVSSIRQSRSGLTWDVMLPDLGTKPTTDQVFAVKISNVYGGKTLEYSFTVFDPEAIVPCNVNSKGDIFDLSTRAVVGSGENILIAGFVITGNEPLRVAARAQGPSLRPLGVNNAATNPQISLIRRNGDKWDNVGAMQNWRDGANKRMVRSYGLAPTDDKDVVAVATLPPGVYCALVSEENDANAGGIGIVEIFDIDNVSTSQLANVSTRAYCGSGEDQLISGIIVKRKTTVVVRTQGPGLVPLGITNAVSGTHLQVFKMGGGQATQIAETSNWKTAPGADRLASDLSYYAPTTDKEAAIVLALDPGAYTFNVTPTDGRGGVAIIEIFKP